MWPRMGCILGGRAHRGLLINGMQGWGNLTDICADQGGALQGHSLSWGSWEGRSKNHVLDVITLLFTPWLDTNQVSFTHTHTHTHTHTQTSYLQNSFAVFYSLIIICLFTFVLLYIFHYKSNSKDIRDSRTSIFLSFILLIFYFILEYRWLTMLWQFQASSERTEAHIHMYPFSLKLPSHPGCHIRLSSVPYAIQ